VDWQLAVVWVVVAAAVGYLGRSAWMTWAGRGKAGCGSGCGKCESPVPAAREPPDRISLPRV
jgi:hypothetical protein